MNHNWSDSLTWCVLCGCPGNEWHWSWPRIADICLCYDCINLAEDVIPHEVFDLIEDTFGSWCCGSAKFARRDVAKLYRAMQATLECAGRDSNPHAP